MALITLRPRFFSSQQKTPSSTPDSTLNTQDVKNASSDYVTTTRILRGEVNSYDREKKSLSLNLSQENNLLRANNVLTSLNAETKLWCAPKNIKMDNQKTIAVKDLSFIVDEGAPLLDLHVPGSQEINEQQFVDILKVKDYVIVLLKEDFALDKDNVAAQIVKVDCKL
jgi:alpha-D-ribose 1-methylphosphonate 5-triphosphate synthase subunit PhnL